MHTRFKVVVPLELEVTSPRTPTASRSTGVVIGLRKVAISFEL